MADLQLIHVRNLLNAVGTDDLCGLGTTPHDRISNYRKLSTSQRKKMNLKIIGHVRATELRALDATMHESCYASSALDLRYFKRAIEQKDGLSLPAEGVEDNRRQQFFKAVAAMRGQDANNMWPDVVNADGVHFCAYDAILLAAGAESVIDDYAANAQLRMARRAFFSEREKCMSIDTALLCLTHASHNFDRNIGTYAAFHHHNQPFIGIESVARKAVYDAERMLVTNIVPTMVRHVKDSIRAAQQMGTSHKTYDKNSTRERYHRGGDARGRTATACHFRVLEEMLLSDEFERDTGIKWSLILRKYRDLLVGPQYQRGGTFETATLCRLFEDFEIGAQLCTEYRMLCYQLVSGDALYDEQTKSFPPAGKYLPKLPEQHVDVANPRAPFAIDERTFGDLNITIVDADVTDSVVRNKKVGLSYVRRAFYTAAKYMWYPHSLAFVQLLNMLEYASVKDDFVDTRSFHTNENKTLWKKEEEDDAVALVVNEHRKVGLSIRKGTFTAYEDAIAVRAKWKRSESIPGVKVPFAKKLEYFALDFWYEHWSPSRTRAGQVIAIATVVGVVWYTASKPGTWLFNTLNPGLAFRIANYRRHDNFLARLARRGVQLTADALAIDRPTCPTFVLPLCDLLVQPPPGAGTGSPPNRLPGPMRVRYDKADGRMNPLSRDDSKQSSNSRKAPSGDPGNEEMDVEPNASDDNANVPSKAEMEIEPDSGNKEATTAPYEPFAVFVVGEEGPKGTSKLVPLEEAVDS